nr:hypothetical protein [Tanacetum cinerariifolium]
MTESPLVDLGFAIPVFSQGDDLIACLNKAMAFLTVVTSSRFLSTNNQLRTSSNPRNHALFKMAGSQCNKFREDKVKVILLLDPRVPDGQVVQTIIPNNATFQTEDLNTYDSECDDILNVKAVLMANIYNYGSDVILKKAQRIKPTLYDGIVMSDKHIAMIVIDDEETLILEEESRSRMSKKEKDQEAIKQNIYHKPIDDEKLNRLIKDFRKRFTPQQELSAEQAFWLRMSDPTSKPYEALPVKIEAPKKLPKISLVNESLKKLKFYLAKFDNVVKIRIAPNARTKENERLCNEINHVQQVFKEQLDSIRKTRVRTKEQSDSLIDKVNLKSTENEDLKAQIQGKVFVITSLKNDLRRIKRKEIIDIVAQKPSANTIVSGKFKLDLEPLAPSQELLVYVRDTCPNAINLSAKKVDVTPKNKVKKVRFAEPLTSSSNSKHADSSNTTDSNTHVLSPIRLKCLTSNYGSKPSGNKKNNRISQTPSRNMKNKVEAQPRNFNKKNHIVEPIRNVDVKQSQLNANSELIFATCSSKKAKIVESKNANHSEPNHTWGSNATDIPSSSSLVMTVQEAAAPRAMVLADSPVTTSIDQYAPLTSIPSSQEQEHSPITSQ